MMREAMKKGGSSDRNLDELIECLVLGKDRYVVKLRKLEIFKKL